MTTQIIVVLLVSFVLERIITTGVLRPKFKQPKYKNNLLGCFAYSAQAILFQIMFFASGGNLEYSLALFFTYLILMVLTFDLTDLVCKKLGLRLE